METSLFFLLSKIIWAVMSPDFILVAVLIAGMVFWFKGRVNLARFLLTCVVLFMSVLTVLPLGNLLLNPLEHRFACNPDLPGKVAGIIMLGGAEDGRLSQMWKQPELKDSADRYIGFIRLMNRYPDAVPVVTGGSGRLARQSLPDADTARQVFEGLGINLSAIVFEPNSRNTYENAVNTKALVNPQPGQVWVLVTSAFHMPRAVGIFNQLHWPVIPYPVDHFTRPDKKLEWGIDFAAHLAGLVKGTKEWTGLAAYYITGKTDAFFPGQDHD